jgi:hypothetical protein
LSPTAALAGLALPVIASGSVVATWRVAFMSVVLVVVMVKLLMC